METRGIGPSPARFRYVTPSNSNHSSRQSISELPMIAGGGPPLRQCNNRAGAATRPKLAGTGVRPHTNHSEMLPQLTKTGKDQQLPRAALHFGVLELPRGRVRDEHGIEPRFERRVDIAA